MDEQEHPDVVDVFYRPFRRPLGNLVITFAQAEAALIELLTELNGGDERLASDLVGGPSRDRIREIIRDSGFKDFELEDLTANLEDFWQAKDKRSRLIHDEWWVGLDSDDAVFVGIRGIPRRKGADVAWGTPTLGGDLGARVALPRAPIRILGIRLHPAQGACARSLGQSRALNFVWFDPGFTPARAADR
jgi:hypothetical protein